MRHKIYFLILLAGLLSACQKEFLDAKSNQSQKVPTTLADYQAMLDNTTGGANPMNERSSHTLGMIGADEYFISDAYYYLFPADGNTAYMRNAYVWAKEVYMPVVGVNYEPYDFNVGYGRILTCNIVLDGLKSLPQTAGNKPEWENVKGSALFYRALNYYNLAQLYAQPLGLATAESLGLPLRSEADPTLKLGRSSLAQTYELIQADLAQAAELLPQEGINLYRPNQLAVQALWMRLYLQQEDYERALEAAEHILASRSELLDYNELTATANYTFQLYARGNKEVFFATAGFDAGFLNTDILQVDEGLYSNYAEDDLRKSLFFKVDVDGRKLYWGSYYGNTMFFTGFALDEVYLVRAEALARLGNVRESCATLNSLLRKRYASGTYSDYVSEDVKEVLDKVLLERRKQLIFRGVRWEDLRRLNLQAETAKTLTRQLGDQTYKLEPNSKGYVWPIPPEAVVAGSFVQNER